MGMSVYTLTTQDATPFLKSEAAALASQQFAPIGGAGFTDAILKSERAIPAYDFGTHGTPQAAPAAALLTPSTAAPTSEVMLLAESEQAGELRVNAASAMSGTPEPAGPVRPPCESTRSSLYCAYTVETGDSLSSIASRFGLNGTAELPAWELLAHSNRPEIASDEDVLEIGQMIRIPTGNAVLHTVLSTETLTDIADAYDVSTTEIAGLTANGIGDADLLVIGQELLVPNPGRLERPSPPPVAATPAQAARDTTAPSPAAATGSAATAPGASRVSTLGFAWPASGPLSSYYGSSHPLGIDIDLFGTPGASNLAAAAGTVTFAGGDPCCSYGYYVVIDHGNGYQSLYAHFSKITVSAGQRVTQGQVLGLAGSTGYSTGTHLHFELRKNGSLVNPLEYLP